MAAKKKLLNKKFRVFHDKWPEFQKILAENKDAYEVDGQDEEGVWIRASINEKELKAVCDLVKCRLYVAKEYPDVELKMFPLSILKDFAYSKKYVKGEESFLVWGSEVDEFIRLGL